LILAPTDLLIGISFSGFGFRVSGFRVLTEARNAGRETNVASCLLPVA
jgi:hypothetical protein